MTSPAISSPPHPVRLITSTRRKLARLALYGFLILTVVYYLLPLVVVLMTSLKSMDEIRSGDILALPRDPSLAAWSKAWFSACTGVDCNGLRVGFWNSVWITVPGTLLSILFGALSGYALSQWPSRLSKLVLLSATMGAFIPYQVILYPMVKIMSTLGLYGNLGGIILIHVVFGMPYMIVLFYNFFTGVPQELLRAAKMDGAGFFQTFFHVLVPMSLNVVIVAAIMQVTGIWNDFLLGLIFAGRDNLPITVQLNNIVNTTTGVREYNVNMAATFLTALPPLLVYICVGKYFARGLTAGAVKG